MILVDSDVIIAHLRGRQEARDWLRDARQRTGPLAVSVISLTEVTGAMRSHERGDVWHLLRTFEPFGVTEAIAYRAGEFQREFRQSHQGIGLGDYLIAGTVDRHGHELATLNVRHFPMFPGLEPPFTLA